MTGRQDISSTTPDGDRSALVVLSNTSGPDIGIVGRREEVLREIREKFSLGDPKTDSRAEVTDPASGLKFIRLPRTRGYAWAVAATSIPHIAERIGRTTRNSLAEYARRNDEIPVTTLGLSAVMILPDRLSRSKIFEKLGLEEAHSGSPKTVTINGIEFVRRSSIKATALDNPWVWVVGKKDIDRLRTLIGGKERGEAAPARESDDIILLSALDRCFRGGHRSIQRELHRKYRLPRISKFSGASIDSNGITFTVKNHTGSRVWTVKRSVLPRIVKGIELQKEKLRLRQLGKLEIPINGELAKYFESASGVHDRVIRECGLAQVGGRVPTKIESHGLTFRLRKNSSHYVWALAKAELPRLAEALKLRLRANQLKRPGSSEISLSGISKDYICSGRGISRRAAAALNLPTLDGIAAEVEHRDGIDFYRRVDRHGCQIWAIPRDQVPVLTQKLAIEKRPVAVPVIGKEQIPVSYLLGGYLIGSGEDLCRRAVKVFSLPDPVKSGVSEYASSGIDFKLVHSQRSYVWGIENKDLLRFADLISANLRLFKVEDIAADEVPVSSRLRRKYIGDGTDLREAVVRTFRLPRPEHAVSSVIRSDSVLFHLRRSGRRWVWAYSDVFTATVGNRAGIQLRSCRPAVQVGLDEIPLTQAELKLWLAANPMVVMAKMRTLYGLDSANNSVQDELLRNDVKFFRRLMPDLTNVCWCIKAENLEQFAEACQVKVRRFDTIKGVDRSVVEALPSDYAKALHVFLRFPRFSPALSCSLVQHGAKPLGREDGDLAAVVASLAPEMGQSFKRKPEEFLMRYAEFAAFADQIGLKSLQMETAETAAIASAAGDARQRDEEVVFAFQAHRKLFMRSPISIEAFLKFGREEHSEDADDDRLTRRADSRHAKLSDAQLVLARLIAEAPTTEIDPTEVLLGLIQGADQVTTVFQETVPMARDVQLALKLLRNANSGKNGGTVKNRHLERLYNEEALALRRLSSISPNYYRFAGKIARSHRQGAERKGLDIEDLVHAGLVAVDRAAEKYEHGHGSAFRTYAYQTMLRAIRRCIDGYNRIRVPSNPGNSVSDAVHALNSSGSAQVRYKDGEVVSVDPVGDDGRTSLGLEMARDETMKLVERVLDSLAISPTHVYRFCLKFGLAYAKKMSGFPTPPASFPDPPTYEDIGVLLGVSAQAVGASCMDVLKLVRAKLTEAE